MDCQSQMAPSTKKTELLVTEKCKHDTQTNVVIIGHRTAFDNATNQNCIDENKMPRHEKR